MGRKAEYVADALTRLGAVRVPPARKIDTDLRAFLTSSSAMADLVRGRELYSFTQKALRAAADLRVDTPERMERLISAVTRTPGRLLLEANTVDLVEILSNIRGFIDPGIAMSIAPSDRTAFAVEITKEAIVTFSVVRFIAQESADQIIDATGLRALARELPTSLKDALHLRGRVITSGLSAKLDIRRHVGISRQEFDQVIEHARHGDTMLDRARSDIAAKSGMRERAQASDAWWRMTRLRDLIDVTPDGRERGSVEHVFAATLDRELADPVRIGLHLIALLAILTAEAREISFYPRGQDPDGDAGERNATAIKRKPDTQRPTEPGQFRVVSLNIDLPTQTSGHEPGGSERESGARARHPVRGHLFLARNGRLVWRKPHWRGSVDHAVIHRVTAKI